MFNLLNHVRPYEPSDTGVGCAVHGDPTCLCDVVVTDPVPVRYTLGRDTTSGKKSVLFSSTVDDYIPFETAPLDHCLLLLGVWDAAQHKHHGLALTAIKRAERTVIAKDFEEYEDSAHKHFKPTPEQEVWLRKDIPHTWAAWNVDQSPEAVKSWRRKNGVTVTKRVSPWQEEGARYNRFINPNNAPGMALRKVNENDPETRALLMDRSLSSYQIAARLNVGVGPVNAARKRIGVKGTSKGGGKVKVDRNAPEVAAVLDGPLSDVKAAKVLGIGTTTVNTYRRLRRADVASCNSEDRND